MSRFSIERRPAGLLAVLALSCAFAALYGERPAWAHIDASAKELAKLDDDWSKAAGKKDADAVASYYADDAIAYPPGEPMAVGRAAAKKVWAAYFADPTFSISWTTVHAEVSKSGDFGYTTGTYQDSFKGSDGKSVTEKGKYVCAWKKDKDGKWKAIHDIWNTDSR